MCLIKKIADLANNGKLDEALTTLDNEIAKVEGKQRAELLFERGKINWRLGNRGKATSDYAEAAALDPESPAVQALENAQEIEAFFNPDLLNP